MTGAALIHSQATPQARTFMHRWIFGIWFGMLLIDPLVDLAYMPAETFQPTGILAIPFAHGLLTVPVLWGLKVALLVVLAFTFIQTRSVAAAVLSGVLLTVHQGVIRGFGYISHGEIVLLLSAYVLILSNIADAIVARDKSKTYDHINFNSIPLIGILAVVCFTYAFPGIYRTAHFGISHYANDTILYHVVVNSNISDTWPFRIHQMVLDHEWLANCFRVGFPFVTILEMTAPLCLVSRRFRYLFVAVMGPFHILSWFFFGVFFWETLALYIVYFDYSRIVK